MGGQSSGNDVPAKYRIVLALSIAFLVHTLILSGFPSLVPDAQEPRHSIHFELLPSGTRASMPKAATPPLEVAKKPVNRNPAFDIPTEQVSQPATSQITSQSSDQRIPDQEPAPKIELQKPEARPQSSSLPTKPTISESKPAQPTVASSAGQQTTTPSTQAKKEQLTRITQSPSEQDPYLITLAIHLGKELEKLRVPAISELNQKVTMEIELQLLGNGALTRTRVLKSTGIAKIDEAAYRASLAASPYPEPPSDNSQSRFEIELVFSPKRL